MGEPSVVAAFREGDVLQSIRSRVSRRLGLDYVLSAKHFKYVTRACSFGYAIDGVSAWCAAFNKQELLALEYMEDLDDYHKDAYGLDINSKMPCTVVRDLIRAIDAAMQPNAESTPRTHLLFSHAGAIKRLTAYFGLFTVFDAECTKFNEHQHRQLHEQLQEQPRDQCPSAESSRKWRSSLISPFSANFAAVLHKCSRADGAHTFVVQTMLQESPLVVAGCDSDMCPVEQFRAHYHSALDCDLNKICRI